MVELFNYEHAILNIEKVEILLDHHVHTYEIYAEKRKEKKEILSFFSFLLLLLLLLFTHALCVEHSEK